MGFRIEKWYFDAHTDDGDAFIGYAARLTWKSVNVHYNGYTFSPSNSSKIFNANSFSSGKFPDRNGNVISWKFNKVEAQWHKEDEAFGELLLNEEKGQINWDVLLPSAKAIIKFNTDKIRHGVGYVEKIVLTLPPWDIPIQELFWGRFLGPKHTLIWIRWRGPVPKFLVYFKGERYCAGDISTDKIQFENYSLDFTSKRTLRKGTILETVFKRFPAIARMFPRKIFSLTENKWLSDAVLTHNGNVLCYGKAIHEHVIW